MSPGAVEPLAAYLRQAFPAALLDLPSILSDTTAAAMTASDRILLVVTPDMASLQSAAVALQAMAAMGIQEDRIWVVLNAPGGLGGLSPQTVSKALRVSLAANIPYEPGMLAALNLRRPLMLTSHQSAAAQAITELGRQAHGIIAATLHHTCVARKNRFLCIVRHSSFVFRH